MAKDFEAFQGMNELTNFINMFKHAFNWFSSYTGMFIMFITIKLRIQLNTNLTASLHPERHPLPPPPTIGQPQIVRYLYLKQKSPFIKHVPKELTFWHLVQGLQYFRQSHEHKGSICHTRNTVQTNHRFQRFHQIKDWMDIHFVYNGRILHVFLVRSGRG